MTTHQIRGFLLSLWYGSPIHWRITYGHWHRPSIEDVTRELTRKSCPDMPEHEIDKLVKNFTAKMLDSIKENHRTTKNET